MRAPRETAERFLSTPSARRATQARQRPCRSRRNFYPRPPRGGRRRSCRTTGHRQSISIHALREEGDFCYFFRFVPFYMISIHALREEGDVDVFYAFCGLRISIHALREEGDSKNREKNILLLSHYTPLCTNCKEMSANQTAKSHRYLRKRLVFRCEASRKTMCAADSHWPDIKRATRCLGQILGAVQPARPWSGSCCPAGRTADCPRQGRSGRSALL